MKADDIPIGLASMVAFGVCFLYVLILVFA
jgi:hypothetical protein